MALKYYQEAFEAAKKINVQSWKCPNHLQGIAGIKPHKLNKTQKASARNS